MSPRAIGPAARAADAARERRAGAAGGGRPASSRSGRPSSTTTRGRSRSRPPRWQTERIELGTAIAWAFGRSPLLTAVTALDLDEMSGGRFVARARHRHAADAHRLARSARRSARRGGCARRSRRSARCGPRPSAGAIEYEGELVRLAVRPYGRAGQVREQIPVYLAAVNEGMARTAGAVADGVIAHPMATVALHRGGDASGDRRGRRGGGPLARTTSRSRTGCIVAVSDDARPGARGREAPDRLPRDRANLRPHPRAARLRRASRREIRELWQQLRPRRDDCARDRRDARRDGGRGQRRRNAASSSPSAPRASTGCCSARRSWRPIRAACASTTTRSWRRSGPDTWQTGGRQLGSALRGTLSLVRRPLGAGDGETRMGWTLFFMM